VIQRTGATIPLLTMLLVLCCPVFSEAQAPTPPTSHLMFAVILSRHGVRSPTGSAEKLNPYSASPWPQWEVPPGDLTPRGGQLMTLFGKYYRDYFSHAGLLQAGGCADVHSVSFVADSDQRTVATGNSLATGMFPNCKVSVHALPRGTHDPLFHALGSGVGRPDHALAAASLSGRIGDNPAGLVDAYATPLNDMEAILSACPSPSHCAQPGKSLLEIPSSIGRGKGGHLVDFRGPLKTASTIAEDFLLEYTDGKPLAEVGWGHVDAAKINEMMTLHTADADLLQRTPYLARAQASNLMSHIFRTLQQSVDKKKIAGALGNPGDKLVLLVGHDTNIATVAGMLGISWMVDGRRDDTPPGGALVFEVWTSGDSTTDTVRTYYTSQTLEQMRNMTPLTLNAPPVRSNIFVPGCRAADEHYSCAWRGFAQTVKSAIDPTFIQ
jgi:4-phytase / acid phosphatase